MTCPVNDDDMRGYDFEFERKFFCRHLPKELVENPDPALIVQGYFLAEEGLALRVRLQANGIAVSNLASDRRVLTEYADKFSFAVLTAKGAYNGGTRYEAERELEPEIAVEMLTHAPRLIIKNRYSLWQGTDGWVLDQFLGENLGLILAECERSGPVTDLQIPAFCTTEVTGNSHFNNDYLVKRPYCLWKLDWEAELAMKGESFSEEFGTNKFLD